MSELDPRFVKQGFWINHSQGLLMGPTITVDTKTGTVIIAVLAVLSALGIEILVLLLFANGL